MFTRRWGLSTQRIQLEKAMTFHFGNDETQETRTLAMLPVGIAGVNGVLRVRDTWWRTALAVAAGALGFETCGQHIPEEGLCCGWSYVVMVHYFE